MNAEELLKDILNKSNKNIEYYIKIHKVHYPLKKREVRRVLSMYRSIALKNLEKFIEKYNLKNKNLKPKLLLYDKDNILYLQLVDKDTNEKYFVRLLKFYF
jgi:hypothetical protein